MEALCFARKWNQYIASAAKLIEEDPAIAEHARHQAGSPSVRHTRVQKKVFLGLPPRNGRLHAKAISFDR